MKPAASPSFDANDIARTPGWITAAPPETIEDAAFMSGAALAHLHVVAQSATIPHPLWRARLALGAAEACVRLSGRPEQAADLRDAICLLRPGDDPGPAGTLYRQWSRAAERALSEAALARALPKPNPALIHLMLERGQGGPVARAAAVIEAVMADAPRAETAALILADGALAKAMGWGHLVPLLAVGMKSRDLRKTDAELRLACHRAVVIGVKHAADLAADLARRAARLRAAAPQLRAKSAGQAVDMLLTRDAVAASALTGVMTDRAARRLCDRLVQLGCIRELTGRDSYRLYGV